MTFLHLRCGLEEGAYNCVTHKVKLLINHEKTRNKYWTAMLLLFCLGLLSPGPWSDVELDAATRASMLLANMSLGEKLVYLHGPRAVWGVELSLIHI